LADAGISPTTIRFAVGDEDPKDLIAHFIQSARLTIEPHVPGFSEGFMATKDIDGLVQACYVAAHQRYIESKAPMAEYLA
jgi:O-acetylhomoserine (thiol)-lyase